MRERAGSAGLVTPACSPTYPWSAGNAASGYRPPSGSVDAHIHLYHGDYPPDPAAILRPQDATLADYKAIQERLGLTRCVIVQPSTYGVDNSCLLDSLGQIGRAMTNAARGIAVVSADIIDADLRHMGAVGVCGLRFNLSRSAGAPLHSMKSLAHRIAALGWHVQVQAAADDWIDLAPILRDLPVPVVIDHMGRLPHPAGLRHPAWPVLRRLVDDGRAWVKLSGAYHETADGPPSYADAGSIVRAWAASSLERLVWGTDWPHPSATAGEKPVPDDAALLDLFAEWIPSERARRTILLDTPTKLYDFPAIAPV